MVAIINMHDAKSRLSELVKRAHKGEEIIIAVHGKPTARLVPISAPRGDRPAGLYAGKIWMSEDFNAPLPDEYTGYDP